MLHTHKVAGSNPAGNKAFWLSYIMLFTIVMETNLLTTHLGFHGVMVSTLDFESSDPSSNLGGTLLREDHFLYSKNTCKMLILGIQQIGTD